MLEDFEKLLGNVFSEQFVEKLKENLKTNSEYWSARYEDGKKVSETHERWENGKLVAGNSSADINGCYVGVDCACGDEHCTKEESENKCMCEKCDVEEKYLAKLKLIDKEVDKLRNQLEKEREKSANLQKSLDDYAVRYENLYKRYDTIRDVYGEIAKFLDIK